jgi:hypothetical protein
MIVAYQQVSGAVALLQPNLGCGLPLMEIARKDVPAGRPFIFVEENQVPQDATFFEAFEADFSNPDGYGIGPVAWFAERAAAEGGQP